MKSRAGRILLRRILQILVRNTINKHKPIIVAIIGDSTPSYIKEIVYMMMKTKYKVRRNLERAESEFSVPLTIFGTSSYPKYHIEWIFILIKTFLQLIYLKPYSHALVLQLPYIRSYILETWIKIIKPDIILNTGDKSLNSKSEILKIDENEIEEINNGKVTKSLQKIIDKYNLDIKKVKALLKNNPLPAPRINITWCRNEILIIDARHYYYPPNIKSVLETTKAFSGKKYVFSSLPEDKKNIPANYTFFNKYTKNNFEENSIIILRGSRNNFEKLILDLK